jgi:hypothetical protein
MPKPKTKTEVATIKLTPQVRGAWEAAAKAERRSLANMFEVAILAWCEVHGIPIPADQPTQTPQPTAAKRSTKKRTT